MRRVFLAMISAASAACTMAHGAPHLRPVQREWFTPRYYSISNVVPVGDTIVFDRRYIDTTVEYNYEILLNGMPFAEATGRPLRCAIPDRMAGSVATFRVSIRDRRNAPFAVVDSARITVGPRALFCTIVNSQITVGEPVVVNVFEGINPQRALPAGVTVSFDDPDGSVFRYHEKSSGSPTFTVPMMQSVAVKDPMPVTIRIHTDQPNQIDDEESLLIMPRANDSLALLNMCRDIPIQQLWMGQVVVIAMADSACARVAPAFKRYCREHVRATQRAIQDSELSVSLVRVMAARFHGGDSLKIVRVAYQCQFDSSGATTTFDRKTGETVTRLWTIHLPQFVDLMDAQCEALLRSSAGDGQSRATIGDILRTILPLR